MMDSNNKCRQEGGPAGLINALYGKLRSLVHCFLHSGCRCTRCCPVTGRLHLKLTLMRPDEEVVLEQTMDALGTFRWDATNPIVMPSNNGSGRKYLYGYLIAADISDEVR